MSDKRDELWKVVYEAEYDARFFNILSSHMAARLQWFDEMAKIVIALTASSSTVAGWTLWKEDAWRPLWLALAGLGALLSILHATLGIPSRLKDWTNSKRDFVGLEIDLVTLRQKMAIDPEFDVDKALKEFLDLKKRYSECIQRLREDIFRTKNVARNAQVEVNDALGSKS